MTVANNWSYRDSRSRHEHKGIHHGNHMPSQPSSMCHIFLLKTGRCLKSPGKWMIVTCHIGGRKSEIDHDVNMHWNGHFRETREFPSHKGDKVNSWVTIKVYKNIILQWHPYNEFIHASLKWKTLSHQLKRKTNKNPDLHPLFNSPIQQLNWSTVQQAAWSGVLWRAPRLAARLITSFNICNSCFPSGKKTEKLPTQKREVIQHCCLC